MEWPLSRDGRRRGKVSGKRGKNKGTVGRVLGADTEQGGGAEGTGGASAWILHTMVQIWPRTQREMGTPGEQGGAFLSRGVTLSDL